MEDSRYLKGEHDEEEPEKRSLLGNERQGHDPEEG